MANSEAVDIVKNIVGSMSSEQRKQFDSLNESQQISMVKLLAEKSSIQPQQQASQTMDQRMASVDANIASRGNLFQSIGTDLSSDSRMQKAMGYLKSAGAPFTLMEAATANPMLQMQRGNFNPMDLAMEAKAGITGQKLGEYGDVGRVAGYPEPVAATMGFMIPSGLAISTFNKVGKTLKKFSNADDAKLLKSGKNLLKSIEIAKNHVGSNLDKAYKSVNGLAVDSVKFYDEIAKLPKPLINKLENIFGKLEDTALGLTVEKLRQIKQTIGKYNAGNWRKGERGLQESLDADDIEKVYGAIKNLTKSTVESNFGKKMARGIDKAEKAMEEVLNAEHYVRKTVVDPTIFEPTRAAGMAAKMWKSGDSTARHVMDTLKSKGTRKARKYLSRAADAMESFNRWRLAKNLAGRAVQAGLIGGVGATVGAKVLGKFERE